MNKIKNEPVEPVTVTDRFEEIADAIIEIGSFMKGVEKSGLTRNCLIELLHAQTKIAKRDIRTILQELPNLPKTYLTPEFRRKRGI